MKDLRFSELLELYGGMLTDKQRGVMEQYYHFDESLAEIAQEQVVSRQAVLAAIRQAEGALSELEDKLGFYQKMVAVRTVLSKESASDDPAKLRDALAKIHELLNA